MGSEDDAPPEDEPWNVLGDYELFEEIGRGGMGIIYRARQKRLRRIVAVKVLRGAEFAGEEARARFRVEAEAAARLQHPGIVAIHDVGEESGVLWFSMDYVPGENLDDHVGNHTLGARDAATLVEKIAHAIQHAHDHGVLHRDLKPSNILLADGQPRITDFGLARRESTEDTPSLTRTGQTLGSPGYSAPEQALRGEADVRTDVYGLGAVLYHLLTGRPPFLGPTLDSILLQLRDGEPVSPRRLIPSVPRDLETICLHALHHQPNHRYATASEMAADLGRFLERKAIHARPSSVAENVWRWCRRHPGLTMALLVAAMSLVFGAVVSLVQVERARASERRAVASAAETRRALYSATILRVQDGLREGSPLAAHSLAKQIPAPGQPDLRDWEWYWLNAEIHQGTLRMDEKRAGEPRAVAWSPDGKSVAVSTTKGPTGLSREIRICDPETLAVRKTLSGFDREVMYLDWHPASTRLLVCDGGGSVSVWNVDTGTRIVKKDLDPVDLSAYRPVRAYWSPDGTQFAAMSSLTGLTLHRSKDGELIRTLLPVKTRENAFAWAPSGGRLAVVLHPAHQVQIITTTGDPIATIPLPASATAISWSPDGTRIAIAVGSGIQIFDPEKPDAPISSNVTLGIIGHIIWRADGKHLIAGGWSGAPVILDGSTGTTERRLYGHGAGWITSMSLQGDRLLTWGKDATLREWNINASHGKMSVPGPITRMNLCGPLHELRADIHQPEPLARIAVWQAGASLHTDTFPSVRAIAWSPDGEQFALLRNLTPARSWLNAFTKPGALIEFRRTTPAGLHSPREPIRIDYHADEILWSPQGDRLLVTCATSRPPFCAVISADSGREICRIPTAHYINALGPGLASATAWSPNGQSIAIGDRSILYDSTTGRPMTEVDTKEVQQNHGPIISLAWSPDSSRIAFGFADSGEVLLLDTRTGKHLAKESVHGGWIRSIAYNPDGTRLATCGRDNTVKVLDAQTLDILLVFNEHQIDVRAVAWSADGNALWSADANGTVITRKLP